MRNISDISALIRLAVEEETAGLLYTFLSKADLLTMLDADQKNVLHGWYVQTARENLLHLSALKRLLVEFHKNRIPVAMIKGMPLLTEVYQDIGVRKMEDIDLWIPENHLLSARSCLNEIGYRQDPVYTLKFQKPGVTIDLHTHFLGADRIRTRRYLFDESPEDTFRNARIVYLNHAPVRCLRSCDQVLFLWLHAAKHNLGKLIWLVDIFTIVRKWNDEQWVDLAARAENLKQTASLVRLLFFLEQLFEVRHQVDEKALPTVACPSASVRYLFRRRIKNGALPFWAPLMLFSPDRGFSNQLRYAIETLFPRPEILRETFTGYRYRLNWPLYGLRCIQLACIAWKKAGDILMGEKSTRGENQVPQGH
ncbi:MAG: nucleotidyltransferase family protein [Desulfobacterales bacterium]|nr:nucleotidyltransferase family protein [Desulfobacterales bacterium]MCF8078440.1 nucleotidyltransferase family protein [Desulfobacterales bacterium]